MIDLSNLYKNMTAVCESDAPAEGLAAVSPGSRQDAHVPGPVDQEHARVVSRRAATRNRDRS